MRLSEAIRLGAMIRPQAYGTYFDGAGTCANGAALEALGILDVKSYANTYECQYRLVKAFQKTDVYAGFRKIYHHMKACPECGATFSEFGRVDAIVHLNNDHRWTRERIADWVESIETAQETPATELQEQQV